MNTLKYIMQSGAELFADSSRMLSQTTTVYDPSNEAIDARITLSLIRDEIDTITREATTKAARLNKKLVRADSHKLNTGAPIHV